MKILTPKRGEEILIPDCLKLIVLETNCDCVKFGVYDVMHLQVAGVLSRQMAEVCRNRSCYFWFPKGGCCMLVVSCAKGKRLSLTGTGCVTVLDIGAESVTLAITGLPSIATSVSNAWPDHRRTETMPLTANPLHPHQFGTWPKRTKLRQLLQKKFWRRSSLRS